MSTAMRHAPILFLVALVGGSMASPRHARADDPCEGLEGAANGICIAATQGAKCDSEEPAASERACARLADAFRNQTGEEPPWLPQCNFVLPIDGLTMIWNGAFDLDVEAFRGEVGGTSLGVITMVIPGDVVTITGMAPATLSQWEIRDHNTRMRLGVSEFDVSCSDADMNGPEDCGKNQGDGLNNDPLLINDWLLEGVIDSDSGLHCTSSP